MDRRPTYLPRPPNSRRPARDASDANTVVTLNTHEDDRTSRSTGHGRFYAPRTTQLQRPSTAPHRPPNAIKPTMPSVARGHPPTALAWLQSRGDGRERPALLYRRQNTPVLYGPKGGHPVGHLKT